MSVLLPRADPRWRGIAAVLRRIKATVLWPIRSARRGGLNGDQPFGGTWAGISQSHAKFPRPGGDAEGWLIAPRQRVLPRPMPVAPAMIPGSVREQLSQVPPLPHVVRELLAELVNPASNARSVARIATSDPALAAALIRTVNSAAFGLRRKVTSITEAVSYLGYTAVRSLVIRMRLDQILRPRDAAGSYDAEDLWIHSLAVSYAGDCLAQRVAGVDRGFIATLGLLHDIGKLAINSHFPRSAAALRERSSEHPDESLLDRERRVIGADHAEIGAMLAAHWRLPRDLIESIRWHHSPDRMPTNLDASVRSGATIVHIANQLAKYCYIHCDDLEIDIIDESAFKELELVGPLARQLNAPMRWAISRAIFFADESSQRPLDSIRRFVRLYHSRQARGALEMMISGRDNEARIGWIEEGDDAWLFDRAAEPVIQESSRSTRRGLAGESTEREPRRFSSRATPRGVDSLVAAVTDHQSRLRLDDEIRLPARFMIRRLLPNLDEIDRGGEIIEIAQAQRDGQFHLAIRSDFLDFSSRFGPHADPKRARQVLEQELANVLNLRWFTEIRASRDGRTLWLISNSSRISR